MLKMLFPEWTFSSKDDIKEILQENLNVVLHIDFFTFTVCTSCSDHVNRIFLNRRQYCNTFCSWHFLPFTFHNLILNLLSCSPDFNQRLKVNLLCSCILAEVWHLKYPDMFLIPLDLEDEAVFNVFTAVCGPARHSGWGQQQHRRLPRSPAAFHRTVI